MSAIASTSSQIHTIQEVQERMLGEAIAKHDWYEAIRIVSKSTEFSQLGNIEVIEDISYPLLCYVAVSRKWSFLATLITKVSDLDNKMTDTFEKLRLSLPTIVALSVPKSNNANGASYVLSDLALKEIPEIIEVLNLIFSKFPKAEICKEAIIHLLNQVSTHDLIKSMFPILENLLTAYQIETLIALKPHLQNKVDEKFQFYALAIDPGPTSLYSENAIEALLSYTGLSNYTVTKTLKASKLREFNQTLCGIKETLFNPWYEITGVGNLPQELFDKIVLKSVHEPYPQLAQFPTEALLRILTDHGNKSYETNYTEMISKISILAFKEFRDNNNVLRECSPRQINDARRLIREQLVKYDIIQVRKKFRAIIRLIGLEQDRKHPLLNVRVVTAAIEKALE